MQVQTTIDNWILLQHTNHFIE